MDNIYFVEPNSNSVISHEHPVRTPGIVVVVRSNWESETGCSRIQNEKISAGQFACGVLMFVVGILQITSMPDNSDDFKFYLPLLGGNIVSAKINSNKLVPLYHNFLMPRAAESRGAYTGGGGGWRGGQEVP